MKINVFASASEVLTSLAHYIVEKANEAIALRGRFSIALSGGSSPKKLYELLATADFKTRVDWEKVYFFFGDERYVPHTDPDSNYLMAKKAFFEPLQISPANIFAVDTSLSPEAAAGAYASTLDRFFTSGPWIFDLVLLGLGNDSHTASLFPYTTPLQDQAPAVKEVFLADKQVFRITLNAPLINQARHIVFLVYGKEKAAAIQQVIEGEKDTSKFPAQLINSREGEVTWFIDQEAASELNADKVC